ncbi:MAG TPA: hypothetical protein PKI33_13920, partial [Anaerolineales bacterium]|nr:hypothetical protein [Anaerolineales bacterium]
PIAYLGDRECGSNSYNKVSSSIRKDIVMGLFGFGKKANKNAPVLSADEVRTKILELNRETAPYQIIDGKDKGVDLIAEWKIVDAKWYELFAKANITKVFRIYMKFDPAKNEVRAKDEEYTVEWRAGVPSLSISVSKFQGQMTSVEFGAAYAFTEELKPGLVYNYRFNTNEIKKPIQEAVAACGWNYKGVAFGKL